MVLLITQGAGGGATDIRVGGTSLYQRIIVAGGGSGAWAYETVTDYKSDKLGYAGGGSSGQGYSSEYCGTQYGAGTGGGFGYGASVSSTSSYQAGGGGGGWYGGGRSTTTYNGTSKVINASGGGSGYVLTSSSYKPSGYAVGSEYYMTEAYTQAGVNQEAGHAEIEFIKGTGKIFSEEKEIEVVRGGTYNLDVNKFHSQLGVKAGNLRVTSMNGNIVGVSGLTITGKALGESRIRVYDQETETDCYIYVRVVEGKKEEIAEGNGYRIIKKRDGTVWSVGQNGAGQLGVRRQL